MADLFMTDFEIIDDEIFLLGDPYVGDMFRKCDHKFNRKFICTKDSKYLFLETDESLCGMKMNKRDQDETDCLFDLQYYDSTATNPRAVMLGVKTKDGRRCVLRVVDSTLGIKNMDFPSEMKEDSHEAIFYMKKVDGASNRHTFESSTCRNFFICSESVSDNNGKVKLILDEVKKNQVDESSQFRILEQKKK